MRRALFGGIAALCVLQMGFVRQTTTTGTPLEWRDRCPLLEIGALDPSGPGLEEVRDALSGAIDAWQSDGCDALPFALSELAGGSSATVYDGRNVVVTRGAGYCDDESHEDEEICLSPRALAITTLYFVDEPGSSRDGEIVEVDMEINLRHAFAEDRRSTAYDLPSVVTHEIGHVLGLAHTCSTEPGARVVDPAGHEVPVCRGEQDDITSDATMYPWSATGEVKRRTPEADERQAMCLLYRAHPATCEGAELTTSFTCDSGSGGGSLLVGAAGIAVALRRRRR